MNIIGELLKQVLTNADQHRTQTGHKTIEMTEVTTDIWAMREGIQLEKV